MGVGPDRENRVQAPGRMEPISEGIVAAFGK
jgi:hypothetical protein